MSMGQTHCYLVLGCPHRESIEQNKLHMCKADGWRKWLKACIKWQVQMCRYLVLSLHITHNLASNVS